MTEKLFAFVLMPFKPEFDDIYRLGVKAVVEEAAMIAERVDEQIYHGSILERIYNQIELADLIIADMSDQNPNVFYEVGYAHAKKKICILITKTAGDIPFDLKHERHIIYESSITELQAKLRRDLDWAKEKILKAKAQRINVELHKINGDLKKSNWSATGIVDVFFDLKNTSKLNSPEIQALYYYTGKGWIYSQDGRPCPSSDSDVNGFNKRYFVTPPLRYLPPGGWAQIKLTGEKILAFATKGQTLKDSYPLRGRTLIRAVTSEGNFDFPMSLEVECDEIPF